VLYGRRAAEHIEQQSNRAVCSRAVCRSHDPCSVVTCQPTAADCYACARSAVVSLGVITCRWGCGNCTPIPRTQISPKQFQVSFQLIHPQSTYPELIQPCLGCLVLGRSTLGLFTIDCAMAKENLYGTIIQAFATSHMQHGDISGYIITVRREVTTSIDVCTGLQKSL